MIRLTYEQWQRIRKHFPEEQIADGRPGRKPIPTRHVLEAVLWILNTGAQWHMLPQSYPNYKTVHGRFQTWCATSHDFHAFSALCGSDIRSAAFGHHEPAAHGRRPARPGRCEPVRQSSRTRRPEGFCRGARRRAG